VTDRFLAPYTVQSIEAMLGLSRSTINSLVAARYVLPSRGPRNEYRFTFQDVVLLRTAYHLQQAEVSPRRLVRALRELRAKLPPDVPLSGLRIKAVGANITVRHGDAQWEPTSGQHVMDFEMRPADENISVLETAATAATASSASEWFLKAQSLEPDDRDAAIQAYWEALKEAPGHVDAYVNLGALLCEAGQCKDALALYERAVELAPDEPSIHFNGALAMEDLHMHRDAIAAYERCLQLAPYLADAHYNVARLYQQMGDGQKTLRHFNAYRRLQRSEEDQLPGA
jgi:tetratricopeptide (TPR) repeat protein